MPGKHVRFSRTKLVHSPATPPMSFASLSPASSNAPLTPPVIAHGLPGPSPYGLAFKSTYSSLPPPQPKYPAHIRPHPLLDSSSMFFDMREHPSYITYHQAPLSSRMLSESAFTQPIRTITITTAHLKLTIRISASNGSYLTLRDVLDGMYNALRKNITPAEFNALPTPKDRQRATREYENRYRRLRSSSAYEEEKRQGMKRVDFLMGMTRFVGLSSSGHGPDSWVLSHSWLGSWY